VRGVCVIGHGRSNANAIKNAIRVAAGLARAQMNDKIEQELSAAAVHPDRPGVRAPEMRKT
jgi:phosphate acyltransferase